MEIEFYPLKLHLVPLILKDVDKISEIYLNVFHSLIENESKENMDSYNYIRSNIENRIIELENFYEDNFGEENIDFIEVARLRLNKLLMFDPFHIKRINEYYCNLLDETEYEEKYVGLEKNTTVNENETENIGVYYKDLEEDNIREYNLKDNNLKIGNDITNDNLQNDNLQFDKKKVKDLSGEKQYDNKAYVNELNRSNLHSLLSIDYIEKPQITSKSIKNSQLCDDFLIVLTQNEYKYLLFEKAQQIKLS